MSHFGIKKKVEKCVFLKFFFFFLESADSDWLRDVSNSLFLT